MSQTTEPHAEDQTAQQAQDAQYYRRVLHELIDIGADLTRLVQQQAHRQAVATQSAETLDHTTAFDRIARAIRRTIMLARTLNEPAHTHAAPERNNRIAARKRIIRAVEDTIQGAVKAGDDAERIHAEFLDRLDEPDLDDDIANLPVDQIIKDICHDLGIHGQHKTYPFKRRTSADIAILAARAAAATRSEPRDASDENVVVAMRPGQRTTATRTSDPP